MVLKDSFIGYCNTIMICNVSPNVTSSENTMNTLRYFISYKDMLIEWKNSRDQMIQMKKCRKKKWWLANWCFLERITKTASKLTSKDKMIKKILWIKWIRPEHCMKTLITIKDSRKKWIFKNLTKIKKPMSLHHLEERQKIRKMKQKFLEEMIEELSVQPPIKTR
jgi:hypothetical protein